MCVSSCTFRVAIWPFTLHLSRTSRTSASKAMWPPRTMVAWFRVWLNCSSRESLSSPFSPIRWESSIRVFNKVNDFFVVFSTFQASKAHEATHDLDYSTSIGEWTRRDIQYCRFKSYDLTYAHYSKFPSWGLQAPSRIETNHTSFPRPPSNPLIPLSQSYAQPSFQSDFPDAPYSKCPSNGTPFRGILLPTKACCSSTTLASKHFMTVEHDQCIDHHFMHISILLFYLQMISHSFFYCMEEYSPLVLFSWWRNKISWEFAMPLIR